MTHWQSHCPDKPRPVLLAIARVMTVVIPADNVSVSVLCLALDIQIAYALLHWGPLAASDPIL